jgi:hypothetical protein
MSLSRHAGGAPIPLPRRGATPVIGSVSVTATTLLCDFEEVLALVSRLIETTNAISGEYGWTPPPGGKDEP